MRYKIHEISGFEKGRIFVLARRYLVQARYDATRRTGRWNLEKIYRSASFPFPRLERVLSTAIITGADLGLGVHEIGAVLRSYYERYLRRYQPPVRRGTISDITGNLILRIREGDGHTRRHLMKLHTCV